MNPSDSLRSRLQQLITESQDDQILVDRIFQQGLFTELLEVGTYNEAQIREQLSYGSADGVRAAVSKSKRGKGSFPLPVAEGRRWSKTQIHSYAVHRKK